MFIIIVLSVILGLTTYVYILGWQALPPVPWVRISYTLAYFLSSACFFLRMFYGDSLPENISVILSAVGFTWMVVVIYVSLFAVVIDIIRLANHFLHFYPYFVTANYQTIKLSLLILELAVISVLLFFGYHKFNSPKVTRVDVALEGKLQNKELSIVMASDFHLSSYLGREDLVKYINLINSNNPDLVLLVGDIADRSVLPLERERISDVLSSIKSRYGTYAVSGNHEFYGGEREKIYDYIKSSGICFLKDSAVLAADSSLYIIGRDDRTNKNRATLADLVKGLDKDIPKILLDHQPLNLAEASDNGVDIQLSGHTHNGQFWPGNLIVSWIFELPYGYMKKGGTHYYVTSGIGLWGPKYRIGTESEIVLLKLKY